MGQSSIVTTLASEGELMAFAGEVARRWRSLSPDPLVAGLTGALGVGKTTCVRGMLRGLGVTGRVPSPTYTLMEQYRIDERDGYRLSVVHLDLYRLASDEELDMIGIRDWLGRPDIWLLAEWPERARFFSSSADIDLEFDFAGETGRRLRLIARNDRGNALIGAISDLTSNLEP
jgi:tRNA threonylcarbamoyladenosine biosynthesis protein TsaE